MFSEHTFIDIFKNVVANPNLNVVNVYIRHRSSEGAAVALSFSGSIAKFVKPKDYWYWTSVDFESVCTRLRLNIDAERRGAGAGTSSTTNRKISYTNYYMVVRDSSTRPIVSVFITPEDCLRLKDTIECNWPRGVSGNTIKTSLLGALLLDSEPLLRQLLDVIAHQHLMLFTKDF